ncbi:hypothetical protein HN51_054709 [Arachis hypogaea]|uniref:uncharacterized protein LOC107617692 n=1 Tax=Arachis ipaensis TaxID=130454 RepID=UPI000A2B3B13|nr:uncharacterized protein LOC107617692 [Arachis ipaensis]
MEPRLVSALSQGCHHRHWVALLFGLLRFSNYLLQNQFHLSLTCKPTPVTLLMEMERERIKGRIQDLVDSCGILSYKFLIHARISDHEKMRICSTLKPEKLSAEAVRHLSKNLAFPSETKPRLNVNKQSRMKSLLQENDHLKSFFDSIFLKSFKNIIIDVKEDAKKGLILYDGDERIHSSGT